MFQLFLLGESRGDGGRTCTDVLFTNEHVQLGVKPAFISAERRPAAGPGTVTGWPGGVTSGSAVTGTQVQVPPCNHTLLRPLAAAGGAAAAAQIEASACQCQCVTSLA